MTSREPPVSAGPRVIAVLGMHRSGTSCLTGLLEDAGVPLGDVQKENPHNPLGNQENLRIMHLHDAVLAANGGSWDAPPADPARWSEEHVAELRDILAGYDGYPRWAFKDPRALFTLDGWLAQIPDLAAIGSFRSPSAVARSLHARSGMPREEALALWCRYNERLLAWHAKLGFRMVSFDAPADQYLASVCDAFAALGIAANRADLRFFHETLRRQGAAPEEEVPEHVAALHARLRESA